MTNNITNKSEEGKMRKVKEEMNKKTKEKILDALEDKKEYELTWMEEVTYSVNIKASSEEEAREMFENGEVEATDKDITDGNFVDGSLEVAEVDY